MFGGRQHPLSLWAGWILNAVHTPAFRKRNKRKLKISIYKIVFDDFLKKESEWEGALFIMVAEYLGNPGTKDRGV